MRLIYRQIVLFSAYSLIGALSVASTVNGQYAVPIWLPAGLAIGAIIAWGNSMLISVFAAVFAVNVYQHAYLHAPFDLRNIAFAIIGTSIASTAAAWAGAHLARRVIDRDAAIGSWKSALQFSFAVGPIAATISSVLGTLSLLAANNIPDGQGWVSLAVWWQGDALGAMLICPVFLSITNYTGRERFIRLRRVVGPLIILTAALATLTNLALQSEADRDRLEFEKDARTISERVRANYEKAATLLRSTERYVAVAGTPTWEGFDAFTKSTITHVPGTQAIAYVPIVPAAQRARFEQTYRDRLPIGITEFTADRRLIRAQQRARYAPLLYVVPPNINPSGLGFDLLSSPARAQALRAASTASEVTVSSPVELLSNARGVNMTIAVRPGTSPAPAGYISAGINAHQIIRDAARVNTARMSIIVRDLSTPAANRLLEVVAAHEPRINPAVAPDINASSLNASAPYTVKVDIPVDGRTWQLEFVPTPEFVAGAFTVLDWILLITGMMIGISTSSFVLFIAGSSVQTEREIERRIEDLRESEQRMEVLIDTAGEAFISIDRFGIVQDWNPEATQMFGWTMQEAAGTELAQLIIPEAMHEAHRYALARFQPGQPSDIVNRRVEMTAVRRDGSTLQVEMLVTMLELHGERTFHAFLHDISERKQLEEERRHAAELKTHFVAMASHEMRTPLTSIIGYAQTLHDRWDALSESQKRQFVEIIQQQGGRFGQLIEDLLTISQIESGRLKAHPEDTDVAAVIRQALDDTETAATVTCPDGLRARIGADHLRQIAINFLRNAQKYGALPITIRAYAVDHEVVMEVADAGEGVPAGFVDQLFEQFAQAHRGDSSLAQGVGLGLSIVKALADAYHGTAWYRPNDPHGAVFGITVPATDDEALEPERPAAASLSS